MILDRTMLTKMDSPIYPPTSDWADEHRRVICHSDLAQFVDIPPWDWIRRIELIVYDSPINGTLVVTPGVLECSMIVNGEVRVIAQRTAHWLLDLCRRTPDCTVFIEVKYESTAVRGVAC